MNQMADTRELLNLGNVTFSSLIQKGNEIQSLCEDFPIHHVGIDRFRMNDLAGITYSTETGEIRKPTLSKFALTQLCNKIGVPSQYVEKCIKTGRIDLARDNVNSWIEDYNKNLFIREYNGTIRGVLTQRYSPCDTPDVLEGVADVLPVDDYKIKGHYISEEFLHLRMVSSERLPIVGEDLFAGISIDSSDVGRSNLSVNFFIWKQVCTNGLIIPKRFGNLFHQRHIGISQDEFKLEMKKSLELIEPITAKVVESINETASVSLAEAFKDKDSMENLILRVRNQTKLSEDQTKKVISLMQDGTYEKNRWGLINSITQVAQEFSLDKRLELERIAGDMLVA